MERAQPGIRSPPQAEIIRLQYKDFIPMGQDPIDQTLAELRQSFADISTMLNIAIALRRNSSHLLTLLRSMMIDSTVVIWGGPLIMWEPCPAA
jgi:hypothetical protein